VRRVCGAGAAGYRAAVKTTTVTSDVVGTEPGVITED
jgi:hypothetical protein